MEVMALDHVNIVTPDVEGTARFYEDLLGLRRGETPLSVAPDMAQWMTDSEGRAIIHINSIDMPRTFPRAVSDGSTGAIHHVAFRCTGFDEMVARIDARGMERQLNEVAAIGLRQIFTTDPNGVLLELNFLAG